MAWSALLHEVRQCRACEHTLSHGPKPLIAAASSSRVVIIGQAPGRIAHETGVPWNDLSGRRLRSWLGVSDDEFYDESLFAIVPMGLCYPGRGKGGDLPPRPECAPLWHPRILPKLRNVQLTVYIGRYAFDAALSENAKSLTECVRYSKRLLPTRILLPHPSPRNQIWIRKNPWFEREVLPALQKRIREIIPYRELDRRDLSADPRGQCFFRAR